jgi:hypothetical protein
LSAPPPIFIVGFQRSGTTLLRLMLDSHPDIAIPLDTVGMWAGYAERLDRYGDLAREENRRRMVEDVLAEERIRLWNTPLSAKDVLGRWREPGIAGIIRAMHEAYAQAHGKRTWGDKDPGNMNRIDQLNAWFPDARIIHIIRDGRDACLSHLTQDFGYSNVLECALAWREEVQWVGRMGRLLGERRYLELRYEDLIREPERCLREVCTFLDVSFYDSMLRYHERVTAAVPDEKRHIWPLIDQPPVAANAGRWKTVMSNGMRICFEKRAGSVLRDHGYEVLPQARGAYAAEVRNLWSVAWNALRHRLKRRPGSSRRRPE